MKKINLLYSILVIASLGIVSSCKDDDDKSRNEILTSRSWTFTKAEIEVNGVSIDVSDYNDIVTECSKDNTITFAANGVYTESVGTDTCDGDEENSTGTWAWADGETKLIVTDGGVATTIEIKTLTETTLKGGIGSIDWDIDGDNSNDGEFELFVTLTAK